MSDQWARAAVVAFEQALHGARPEAEPASSDASAEQSRRVDARHADEELARFRVRRGAPAESRSRRRPHWSAEPRVPPVTEP